jgi:hypothetical protein
MRGVVVPIFLARACTGGYLENGNTCKTRPFTTKLVLSGLSEWLEVYTLLPLDGMLLYNEASTLWIGFFQVQH